METEDTQTCSKTDAAAVTRKRRSSILKNQRPPRTPFSEVEFNVATPPDTTKSRRVSFSRRTGVAEFVTNEATTTWRNFYEEHNKSLESSGNENNLAENTPRQTIEHIGKRMFDQQFEEVEAVDLGGTIHANPLQQFQASFNKINLTQELASLECMTDDLKFVPSQSKFEQSALTELSKPFGNDIQCPVLDDMTNPISMNFTMQPLSSSKCDDLDEIQNDLERSKPSGLCPGPMNPGKDFSGYIEVADLDITHGVIHNDGSEMSITDTIESPKVQDAAKNSIQQSKNKIDEDWTNDKENMVFNPYVAPKESLTFAVNKVSDEVLVFDGKRLTTQSITSDMPEKKENFRQTLLPNALAKAPQRKTIILDVNDDLPNFIDNNSSKSSFNLHVSSIQPADNVMAVDKENKSDATGHNKSIANDTIDMCDTSNMLSFTQAISSNIIAAKRESLHAKHYHDMVQDISMTQPLPYNIIQMNEENILQTDNNEKRRTIIFAGDSCDISLTQVLQSNKNFNSENVSAKNGNTIIFDNDAHDISMTQALPTNINVNILDDLNNLKNKGEKDASSDKRKTIVFDEDSCNISMTQAVPVNIIGVNNQSNNVMGSKDLNNEKRRTIIFDHESCDISMTQALPSNINVINENKEVNYNIVDENLPENKNPVKRQTIIFDKESCEISMTQILPTNIKINDNIDRNNEFGKNIVSNDKSDKHRTIIFDKDSCDISVTQALPTNINLIENLEIDENIIKIEKSEKRRTIIFDKNSCDISMTQALPTNINLIEILKKNDEDNNKVPDENTEKLRKNIFEKESCDISMTKVLPTNIKENTDKHSKISNEILEKSKTIIFDKNSFDISMTQAISSNINFEEQDNIKQSVLEDNVSKEISTKRKTIIFDQESCDISMTQALPTNINIFRDSLDKDESDIKLELKNATGIVNDNITDEKLTVRANTPQEPNTNDSKNVNHLSTTEIYDDNCKSSDQTDQLKIEKIDKTQNSEMNLCKTVQPNSFMHEDDQNAKLNTSLSNSTCHENTHVKETSYSRVNISKMDTECNDILNSDGVNLPLRNKSNLSYFNKETIDQTSQYRTYETDFKTNISTYYQVDTNKEMNKSSIEICNDELVEKMDMDKSIKLFKNKTIDGSLRDNTISNFKSGQKNSILNELLSMSTESVKEDLSKLDNKEDTVNRTEIKNENSILISTLNEPNCKESFPVENILAYDKNEPDVEIKSNDSVIFMEDEANRNHTNECIKNNDSREQSNADEDAKDKSYKQDHSKFNMELEESVKFISESNSTKTFKSVKEADNTKDLLKMLSDITDEDGDESIVKQEEFNAKNIDTQKPLTVEKNTIATKGIIEPKRLSLAPRRQSIAISREDLLNNISMAKAALQQSRFEVDETEIMDDTSELIETHEINDTHKSNRMSSEVVKTLQFEDESASDTSVKSEIRMTPLRKSANDEITSMYDKKAKVIPTLLTDVSVSLKELMHDLVKPNSDAPFETNFSEMNVPSTCNVEVEANLVTSSQIDVSQKDPTQCVLKNSDSFLSKSETKNVGLEVDSVILLNDIKSSVTDFKPTTTVQHTIDQNNKNLIDNIVKWNVNDKIQTSPPKSKHQSIVFDTDNPLKNIILPPIDYSNAHRYNQLKEEKDDDDTANKSRKPCKMIELDAKSSNLTDRSFENDLLKEKKITEQMNIVCGHSSSKRAEISDSNDSIMKLTNIDKSVNSIVPNISSSTLIHERIMDGKLEMNIEPSMEPLKETDIVSSKISPVKILFRNENDTKLTEKDPDAWSSDEICKVDLDAKTRKRSYSPTSANSHVASNVEVTPKPISKMQKMSNSPLTKSTNHTNDNEVMQVDEEEAKSPKCDKSTINSAARTEIVQKVDIHYNSYCKSKSKPQILQGSKVDEEETLQGKECSKQLSFSSESIQEPSATISQIVSSVTSRILTSEEEARNVDTDAGPDVIDAIKSLSFMGTSECDWERRARDAWCFRLLCGRVRLRVRLYDAAVVSACTPVTAVDVEIAKADARDPIAGMCVSLAVEAMRYEAAEVPRADAVAALLRRCVRVARLARRWARAMRDAHARLAYNVLPDGHISLKVANLPLRRVVEARLHVSLAVGRERGAAYPCADRLTLAAQEAGPDLARLADQPPDWGHVPRTIWKVFKYLKNRTRTEELLGV